MPYDQTIIVPIVMGKEGVYGIRNADRVPMGGARLVRNVSLEGRTMRTEGGSLHRGLGYSTSSKPEATVNGCAYKSRLAFRGKAPPQSAERAYALGQALAVGIPGGARGGPARRGGSPRPT